MSRILLLEDDISLVDGLKYLLEKNEYELTIVRTVTEALDTIQKEEQIDLLLLDVTLPDGTGFDVCDHVRKEGNEVPIIFLTASDEEYNIIRGLDSGGDDYITKPFKMGELLSRIRALLRRSEQKVKRDDQKQGINSNEITLGNLRIDRLNCRTYLHEEQLDLSVGEFRLLCLLIDNRGQTILRNQILDTLWDGNGNFVDDNTLSVYIRRLREKIEENPSKPEHLITVRGFGYRWQ